jgi:hypothetical protein
MDYLLLFLSPLGASALFGFRGGPLSPSVLLPFRGFVGDGGNLDNGFGCGFWRQSLPFCILMGKVNGSCDRLSVARGFSLGSYGLDIDFDLLAIPQWKLAFRFPHVFNLRFQ